MYDLILDEYFLIKYDDITTIGWPKTIVEKIPLPDIVEDILP